jgi:arabinan endo-1,5-alpha-L-arabinosidase
MNRNAESTPPPLFSSLRLRMASATKRALKALVIATSILFLPIIASLAHAQRNESRPTVDSAGSIMYGAAAETVPVLSATAFPHRILNIDNSGPSTIYDAMTDGMLLLRYLLGHRGDSLIVNSRGAGSALRDAIATENYISNNLALFDVDGDGQVLPHTDGLMILRRLLNPNTPTSNAAAMSAITARAKRGGRTDVEVVNAIDALKPSPGATTLTIGGSVSGLYAGARVVLRRGTEALRVEANGVFNFKLGALVGSTYWVTVSEQPAGQSCAVSRGQGIANMDVLDVSVVCTDIGFEVGGSVTGLPNDQAIAIRNNNGALLVARNGNFTFPDRVARATGYAVAVHHQPIGGDCVVSSGIGTVAVADVNTVVVSCTMARAVSNPVYPPFDARYPNDDFPDPSIIRHSDGYWYAYATGARVAKSRNLVSWERLPRFVDVQAAPGGGWRWGVDAPNAHQWAPDIVKIGGQFVLYYSQAKSGFDNWGIGVATAPSPEGPWTDQGKLFDSDEIGVFHSIDSTVFVAEDGRVYMFWGSFYGNYYLELSSNGLALKDGSVAAAKLAKKLVAGREHTGGAGSDYEALHVRYRAPYYYMFSSIERCCSGVNSTYSVRVTRSLSPTGPYVDRAGHDLFNYDTYGVQVVQHGTSKFIGPGHNAIAEDDAGNWWLVYHSYVLNSDGVSVDGRRQLMIDKLTFDAEGWPTVATQNNEPRMRPFDG